MNNDTLIARFLSTRESSVNACSYLETEDYGLQAVAFVSPPKWHLAHTSWFFETFILKPFADHYRVFHPDFEVLFNSYYNAVGEQYSRPGRGLLSRPTLKEVIHYRQHIDHAMVDLLKQVDHSEYQTIKARCILGMHHEKQHQELFYTDIKYSFFKNPLYPALKEENKSKDGNEQLEQEQTAGHKNGHNGKWVTFAGGLVNIGVSAPAQDGFFYDNEAPQHQYYLEPFSLAKKLVTNAEYQAFVDDGGYQRPELWLSDGWATVQENGWQAPLYWLTRHGESMEFTLHGLQPRQPDQPVCHVSGYEADAYARWAGARLPTEQEWEWAAKQQTFSHSAPDQLHPQSQNHEATEPLSQLYECCWQWTGSAYRPYPGFEIAEGAIGEYNGKFMCNQWVLRGGSCVSSQDHLRPSYRNFFYPEDRWQFSGIRLAK